MSNTTMKCPNCGGKLELGYSVNFCPFCGAKIEKQKDTIDKIVNGVTDIFGTKSEHKQEMERLEREQWLLDHPEVKAEIERKEKEKEKKSNKETLVMICLLIAICVIVYVAQNYL